MERKIRRANAETLQGLRLLGFKPETSYKGCDACITLWRRAQVDRLEGKEYDFLFTFEEILPEDFFTDTLQVLNGDDMPICKATAGDYKLFQSTRYLRLANTDHERIKKMMGNE